MAGLSNKELMEKYHTKMRFLMSDHGYDLRVSPETVRVASDRSIYTIRGGLVNVNGDGNCGPRSIVKSIFAPVDQDHEDELQISVRMEILNYYRDHPDEYLEAYDNYIGSHDFPNELRNIHSYIDYMKNNQTHFSIIEFLAASKLYGIQIVILGNGNIDYWFGDFGPIAVIAHENEHFNIIPDFTFVRI